MLPSEGIEYSPQVHGAMAAAGGPTIAAFTNDDEGSNSIVKTMKQQQLPRIDTQLFATNFTIFFRLLCNPLLVD